ncbi:MAG: 16S rRNA (cytidine(1402)-2'-O)-methyltransferase [Candidatus Moranbacteria bacterium]|nr:16S rRNA (cytidine(1402)-2'-O)-methyltransferase [Candidatus Moranbacteria bacterium]
MQEYGKLYVVATPIGNLEDITFRAIRILGEVDYILCEDTRTTQVLLNKYNLKTKTMSYHAHSTEDKENSIINLIKSGKNLALVSDAGTPCISDPGVLLVSHLKKELGDEVIVSPIPGANALIAALSASGISAASFTFLGFIPHKKGREKIFREIAESTRVMVFYESTHRLMKALESLDSHCPSKIVLVAKEITKTFEEFIEGKPKEVIKIFEEDKTKQKGEFVIIVKPK